MLHTVKQGPKFFKDYPTHKRRKLIKLTSASPACLKKLPNGSSSLKRTFIPLKSTWEKKASPKGISSSIELSNLASLVILCLSFLRASCHDAYSSTTACSFGRTIPPIAASSVSLGTMSLGASMLTATSTTPAFTYREICTSKETEQQGETQNSTAHKKLFKARVQ